MEELLLIGEQVYLHTYTITNLDSYIKVQNRYLSSPENLKLNDNELFMRKLINKFEIESLENLTTCSLRIIEDVLIILSEFRNTEELTKYLRI